MLDIELLIREVYRRPAIWDCRNTAHYNREVTPKLWKEVAVACGVPCDRVKTKWKSLKDNFRSELKKSLRGKSEEPGENPNDFKSSWIWFKSLFFLKDQMGSRKRLGKLPHPNSTEILVEVDVESLSETVVDDVAQYSMENDVSSCFLDTANENDDSTREIDHLRMALPKTKMQSAKRSLDIDQIDFQSFERKKVKLREEQLLNMLQRTEDDTYQFLMSLLPSMKSLPLTRQMYVRLKMQELIYNEVFAYQPAHHSIYSTTSSPTGSTCSFQQPGCIAELCPTTNSDGVGSLALTGPSTSLQD